MTPTPRVGPLRPLRRLALSGLLLLAGTGASCSSSDEQAEGMTFTEFLEENSSIIVQLGGYDIDERARAVNRIKALGRETGSQVIVHLLMEQQLDNPRAEVVLARILADWRDRRAIEYLVGFLGVPGASQIAAEGLKVFHGDPYLIEVLEQDLKSPVNARRRIATEVLSEIGGEEAVGVFGERYKGETDRDVRALFLFAIRDSEHPRRKEFLVDALTDPEEGLRVLAWRTLSRYDDLPPVDFDPAADPAERSHAVATLRVSLAGPDARRGSNR